MIKLERIEKPSRLTEKKQQELTERFKQNNENVWNKSYIKEKLLEMSHNKCCYCEVKLNSGSRYVEVEHFKPKSKYHESVLEWNNLLPSCKRCNGKKGEHDVESEPIINPTETNPSKHLYIQDYRVYSKTDLGKATIDILYLNDRKHLVTSRFEIGNTIVERLEDILDLLNDYIERVNNSQRRKNKIIERLQNLMSEAIPTAEFSATSATTVFSQPDYKEIKEKFKALNWWTSEFIILEEKMKFCSLLK